MQRAPRGVQDTEANAFPKNTHRIGRLPLVTWSQNGRVLTSDTRRSLAVQLRHSVGHPHLRGTHSALECTAAPLSRQARLSCSDGSTAEPQGQSFDPMDPGAHRAADWFGRTTAGDGPATAEGAAPQSADEWPRASDDGSQGERAGHECSEGLACNAVLPARPLSAFAPLLWEQAPFQERISCQPQDRFTLSQGQLAGQASSTSTLVVTGQVSA